MVELLVVLYFNSEAMVVFLAKKFVVERLLVVDEDVFLVDICLGSGTEAELDRSSERESQNLREKSSPFLCLTRLI